MLYRVRIDLGVNHEYLTGMRAFLVLTWRIGLSNTHIWRRELAPNACFWFLECYKSHCSRVVGALLYVFAMCIVHEEDFFCSNTKDL